MPKQLGIPQVISWVKNGEPQARVCRTERDLERAKQEASTEGCRFGQSNYRNGVKQGSQRGNGTRRRTNRLVVR